MFPQKKVGTLLRETFSNFKTKILKTENTTRMSLMGQTFTLEELKNTENTTTATANTTSYAQMSEQTVTS